MENSVLGTLVKGVLADYLGETLSKAKLQEATARIVKGYLMTREGANLPEEGTATSFSGNEPENTARQDAKEEELEELIPSPVQAAQEEKKDPYAGTRVKAIVSMPDVGEEGDAGPVTIRTRN